MIPTVIVSVKLMYFDNSANKMSFNIGFLSTNLEYQVFVFRLDIASFKQILNTS